MIDDRGLRVLLPMTSAIVALEAALRDGTAPGAARPRTSVLTESGELLLMPAASPRYVGVKLASVAPGNVHLGLPRVQGVYVLFDGVTLVAGSDLPDDLEGPLRRADVVVCATTARSPLFDSAWLSPEAVVVAVGSHEPDAREVDTALVRRATVVVETRESALREAGDLMIPIRDLEVDPAVIGGDLAELVNEQVDVPAGRPRLFKSVGEAWEDLVVASAAYDQLIDRTEWLS